MVTLINASCYEAPKPAEFGSVGEKSEWPEATGKDMGLDAGGGNLIVVITFFYA